MRLSRLGTDSSLPHDYQGFRGRVRVGPIDPRGGSAEQLPAHQPIGVVRRPFKEPPLTAKSGDATRAALLAMRAHRGTGSSNPLSSSGESTNFRFLSRRRPLFDRMISLPSRGPWDEKALICNPPLPMFVEVAGLAGSLATIMEYLR
jgi:hypothetical protein